VTTQDPSIPIAFEVNNNHAYREGQVGVLEFRLRNLCSEPVHIERVEFLGEDLSATPGLDRLRPLIPMKRIDPGATDSRMIRVQLGTAGLVLCNLVIVLRFGGRRMSLFSQFNFLSLPRLGGPLTVNIDMRDAVGNIVEIRRLLQGGRLTEEEMRDALKETRPSRWEQKVLRVYEEDTLPPIAHAASRSLVLEYPRDGRLWRTHVLVGRETIVLGRGNEADVPTLFFPCLEDDIEQLPAGRSVKRGELEANRARSACISRKHARLSLAGLGLEVEDMSSWWKRGGRPGVYWNGSALKRGETRTVLEGGGRGILKLAVFELEVRAGLGLTRAGHKDTSTIMGLAWVNFRRLDEAPEEYLWLLRRVSVGSSEEAGLCLPLPGVPEVAGELHVSSRGDVVYESLQGGPSAEVVLTSGSSFRIGDVEVRVQGC
jgi:hypothetical protein